MDTNLSARALSRLHGSDLAPFIDELHQAKDEAALVVAIEAMGPTLGSRALWMAAQHCVLLNEDLFFLALERYPDRLAANSTLPPLALRRVFYRATDLIAERDKNATPETISFASSAITTLLSRRVLDSTQFAVLVELALASDERVSNRACAALLRDHTLPGAVVEAILLYTLRACADLSPDRFGVISRALLHPSIRAKALERATWSVPPTPAVCAALAAVARSARASRDPHAARAARRMTAAAALRLIRTRQWQRLLRVGRLAQLPEFWLVSDGA